MSLLNKFIFIDRGEYCQSGKITGVAVQGVYLVILDPNDNPPVSVLIDVDTMLGSEACFIFESRKEMDEWAEWVERDEPKKIKVVPIKRVEH